MTPAARNPLAIGLATLLYFAFGAVWFSLLQQAWLTAINRTLDDLMKTGISPAIAYTVALVTTLFLCLALDWVIRVTGPQTASRGIAIAAVLWFCFVFATFATEFAFESRTLKALAIIAGYPLFGMVLAGAVLGGWKRKLPA